MPGHPAIWSQWRNGETHPVDGGSCHIRDEPASRRLRHELVKRPVVQHVKPVVIGGVDKQCRGGGSSFLGCMVTDTGGINDKSFNQSAWQGMQEAAAANPNVTVKYLQSTSQSDYVPNINTFLGQKCGIIVTVGFLMAAATQTAAQKNPTPALRDRGLYAYTPGRSKNIDALVFNTVQDGFLGGYLAAGMTKTGKVATFGGMKLPHRDDLHGRLLGRRAVLQRASTTRNVQVLGWNEPTQKGSFTGDFTNQTKGQTTTQTFISEGADVIFPVAGNVGLGAAKAVQNADNAGRQRQHALGGHRRLRQRGAVLQVLHHQRDQGHPGRGEDRGARPPQSGSFKGGNYIGTLANGGAGALAVPRLRRQGAGRAAGRAEDHPDRNRERDHQDADQEPGQLEPARDGTTVELELRGITKRFGPLVANDGISLSVAPGQVHALLGENGAGKTTLMNVLYGLMQPDEGEILIDGKPARFHSPKDAIAAGIGMVHQHFMLVPVFTVAENVTLGIEQAGRARPARPAQTRREVADLSHRYGLDVDPDALVEDLPVGIQQRVEIVKALVRQANVLILDEPTAVLTPAETEELFRIIRQLRDGGTSVIFISHKLREVQAIADTITVLRRGAVVGERDAAGHRGRPGVADGRQERAAAGQQGAGQAGRRSCSTSTT